MKRATVTIRIEKPGWPTGTVTRFETQGYGFELDGIPFVVHRIGPNLGWPETTPKGWSVTEPLTGCALGPVSRTRTGACMRADNLVRRKGAAAVHNAIERWQAA